MALYFIILFILIFADLAHVKSKSALIFVFAVVGAFLCMGYMTGSDWRSYEIEYNETNINELWNGRIEYGYNAYMLISKYLGINFWPFFIFTKWVLLYFIFKFIIKLCGNKNYFSLAMYFAFSGVFLFIDNPMRNLIGSVIFLFSIKYVLENNFTKYTLICLLSSLFHLSFLFFIPVFFILNINFKSRNFVIAFILMNLLLLFFSDSIVNGVKLLEIFNYLYTGKLQEQVSGYVLSEELKDTPFTLGMLSRYMIFAIIIISRKKIESYSNYGRIIFNASIFSLFITRLTLVWPISLRFSIPFSVFYSVCLGIIVIKSKGNFKLLYYMFFLFIALGTIYTQVTGSYKYIPYSNYFEYIFSKKPDYNYRCNYNYNNSPYK